MIGEDDPTFVPTRSTILSELTVIHAQLLILGEHARVAMGVGQLEQQLEDAMYAVGKPLQTLLRAHDE